MRYPTAGREEPNGDRLDLVLTAGFVLLSVVLLQLDPAARLVVTDTLRQTVLYPVLELHDWFAERAALAERAASLAEENARLQARILEREGLVEENAEFRRELEMGPRRRGEFVAAELAVGRPRLAEAHRFQVDVGRRDGIRAPAGVVVAGGVVGVIRSVTATAATGDFWTQPDFRVSVRTVTGDATGLVRATEAPGGGGGAMMLFDGAPYQRELPAGTLLETTGAGGVYPPGVPVGVVERQAEVQSGWSRSYLVRPRLRPQDVRVALVWIPPSADTTPRRPSP